MYRSIHSRPGQGNLSARPCSHSAAPSPITLVVIASIALAAVVMGILSPFSQSAVRGGVVCHCHTQDGLPSCTRQEYLCSTHSLCGGKPVRLAGGGSDSHILPVGVDARRSHVRRVPAESRADRG